MKNKRCTNRGGKMKARNKNRLTELRNQIITICVDGIDFECKKKNLLYLLSTGKAPMPILNSVLDVAGEDNKKNVQSLQSLYSILEDVVIDPEIDELREIFSYWSPVTMMKLFNGYCYAINTNVKIYKVDELLKDVDDQTANAKNC